MNTKKITASLVSFATATTLVAGLIAVPANAASVSASASLGAAGLNAKAQANAATRLPTIIARSDTAITARIAALNNLNTRVQGLKNVSASEKTTISNEVQSNISGLTNLKAKIDADTDVTVALSDEKTITGSFRIYALVVPQGYILAAADRVNTISDMMSAIAVKLQARIAADQSAGKDVTALQASLSDLNAKITDAKAQSATSVSAVASLTPDQGNKAQLDANTAALKAGRADIKAATSDLQAARSDAKSILAGLKTLGGGKVTASSSANVQ